MGPCCKVHAFVYLLESHGQLMSASFLYSMSIDFCLTNVCVPFWSSHMSDIGQMKTVIEGIVAGERSKRQATTSCLGPGYIEEVTSQTTHTNKNLHFLHLP